MTLLVVAALLIAAAIALWFLPRNSRLYWKLPMRIVAGIVMCVSALTMIVFLLGGMMCGRYEFPPISSKDSDLVAEVNGQNCGVTDSMHSSVDLWHERHGFFARLFGKRKHSTTVFTIEHDPRLLEVSWLDEHKMLIHYPSDFRNASEFRCLRQWEGVQIECVGYAPDYNKPLRPLPPGRSWPW